MKTNLKLLLIGLTLFASNIALADSTIAIQVTASTTVNNLPPDFSSVNFALMRPWEMDVPPGFAISGTPVTQTLTVNSANVSPALRLVKHSNDNNLTWFYYCDGIKFNYVAQATTAAKIIFTGLINANTPGTGVQCTCSGSACSTQETVPARLIIR